jgi:hypothetical protein
MEIELSIMKKPSIIHVRKYFLHVRQYHWIGEVEAYYSFFRIVLKVKVIRPIFTDNYYGEQGVLEAEPIRFGIGGFDLAAKD